MKYKYHWIEWKRKGPKEGPPLVEKVVSIMEDWCRTSFIALVASGKHMKYYLATENMKPGDLIKTSMHIPRIPGDHFLNSDIYMKHKCFVQRIFQYIRFKLGYTQLNELKPRHENVIM